MSYSAQFQGTRREILQQLLAYADDQKTRDAVWATQGVIDGHQAQLHENFTDVEHVSIEANDEIIAVDVWGHAGDDGKGQCTTRVTILHKEPIRVGDGWTERARKQLVGESAPTTSEGPEAL